jgi:hypothetical protein
VAEAADALDGDEVTGMDVVHVAHRVVNGDAGAEERRGLCGVKVAGDSHDSLGPEQNVLL